MLRRRIFSGAMASVMALSSVAVVASAEETQVKTKADLEKLVNETYGDAFRTDKLSEYGSVSAEAVLDALEAADAILYDAEATAEDYTVAYMMVEATVNKLVIHTAEELQALIDDCKAAYESNNILNDELQDLIYDETKYNAFVEAYDNATNYVTSSSSVDITEAYELLLAKKNDLPEKDKVTKSQFRSMMKKYEAIISAEYEYETWRRGTFSGVNTSTGDFWKITANTSTASFGTVWEAVMACQGTINAAYEAIDEIKNLSKTTDDTIVSGYKMAQDCVNIFNGWSVDSSTRATKSGVNALLKEYHSNLVAEYAATSASALYNAIMEKTESNTNKDGTPKSNTWFVEDGYTWVNGWNWAGGVNVQVNPRWNVNIADFVYVAVDANGYAVQVDGKYVVETSNTATLPTEAAKWQKISQNTNYDILKLVKVTADMVTPDAPAPMDWKDGDLDANQNITIDAGSEWPADVAINGVGSIVSSAIADYDDAVINLSDAYGLAMDYLEGNAKDSIINDIDTTGVIAGDDIKGNSSKEWALVYRYLNYALTDKYNATYSSDYYTKADVKALIEKAYDLAEKTGEASIFEEVHMNLVEARQDAIAWVKEASADKLYKESNTVYAFGDNVDADGKAVTMNSTEAYKALNDQYKALEKAYNAMMFSFGDIYSKLAEVAEQIDDGELEATADLLAAMESTAYALSVVADDITTTEWTSENPYTENPGFDVDRVLQYNNRIITNSSDPVTISDEIGGVTTKDGANPTHAAIVSAYNALMSAVAKQTAPAVVLGDVDGNGTVNALDAAALLQAIVADKALDLAVADYDKSGTVNALDASAILIAIVNGTV